MGACVVVEGGMCAGFMHEGVCMVGDAWHGGHVWWRHAC